MYWTTSGKALPTGQRRPLLQRLQTGPTLYAGLLAMSFAIGQKMVTISGMAKRK
jgi:hypothetical protein